MADSITRFLGVLPDAVHFDEMRATVIAGNIANVDTPNFKAKDLDFRSALEQVQKIKQKDNFTKELSLDDVMGVYDDNLMYRNNTINPRVDNNTVDIDAETTDSASNSIHQIAGIRFLTARIQALNSAIKGGV